MGLCVDVLPPGAEPVYPGHLALCQATPGEGEGTKSPSPPLPPVCSFRTPGWGDAGTSAGSPMTLHPKACLLYPAVGTGVSWSVPAQGQMSGHMSHNLCAGAWEPW